MNKRVMGLAAALLLVVGCGASKALTDGTGATRSNNTSNVSNKKTGSSPKSGQRPPPPRKPTQEEIEEHCGDEIRNYCSGLTEKALHDCLEEVLLGGKMSRECFEFGKPPPPPGF